jgi:hypothetical protein
MASERIKKDTIDKKAAYKKPQVQRVRLTINNPVLGLCVSAGPASEPVCNISPLCPWP